MSKRHTKTSAPLPFKKEFKKRIVTDYSSTHKMASFVPKGNKYTRDNAEDFPSEIDHDSLYVRHEKTHTRRNSNQFGNVTTPLKEYRKSDPTRLKPRAKLDHSMDRRSAQPLGGNTKIKVPAVLSDHSKKATVKKFKKEEFKEEAKRLKAKKILEADKKLKNERRVIKVELPEKIEPGFALDDIIKVEPGCSQRKELPEQNAFIPYH